jgi:enoyl-[acyl-carrier protein] reductase II
MIKSAISEMLGIKYPVFQGGMAWIADGKLAAAVSNGGGLGIIAAGNAPGDYVRQQIQVARGITDKPIGVNIMLLSPFAEEVAKIVIEEKVEVVTTGAGNPSKYMKEWLAAARQAFRTDVSDEIINLHKVHSTYRPNQGNTFSMQQVFPFY